MTRALLAAMLACASAAVSACPLCLGAGQQTESQQLISAKQAVLAVPTADPSHFRVIEVIKGERPTGTIEGGYPRSGHASDVATAKRAAPLLLVHDETFPTWVILGEVGADRLGWLRKLAAGKPAEQMSAEDWRARVALAVGQLESPEPLVAEFAYDELATVPYAALRTAKPRLHATTIRRWLSEPKLVARQRLYTLLLGIAGDAQDAAGLERRLEASLRTGDATNVGPMLAADLELRGPSRMAWVETNYLRDRARSAPEISAALLALSVHGNANGAVPRQRVIQSYRVFIKEHPGIAGYVALDFAAWQYWDAVPEYVALMKSDVSQQFPSRLAILAYLRQSPSPEAREVALRSPALLGVR